jgi:hypothetical protein
MDALCRIYTKEQFNKENEEFFNAANTIIMNQIKEILQGEHIFNVSQIEKQAGIRKLKVHGWIRGKEKLSPDEELKIKQLLKNATKLQK